MLDEPYKLSTHHFAVHISSKTNIHTIGTIINANLGMKGLVLTHEVTMSTEVVDAGEHRALSCLTAGYGIGAQQVLRRTW